MLFYILPIFFHFTSLHFTSTGSVKHLNFELFKIRFFMHSGRSNICVVLSIVSGCCCFVLILQYNILYYLIHFTSTGTVKHLNVELFKVRFFMYFGRSNICVVLSIVSGCCCFVHLDLALEYTVLFDSLHFTSLHFTSLPLGASSI